MKQTILFVDDDASLLTGLQRMLRSMRSEWETTFVSNPTEAIKLMNTTCFDVVATDMRMPTIDGARLLGEVRALCPHSVRIVLSGQADQEIVLRAVEHAHQYISKPCDAEVLKTIIKQACNLRVLITNEALRDFIAQIRCLPVDEDRVKEVVAILQSESPDLERLTEIITSDMGMCSKLLQLVNSSFFTSTRAPSCRDAIRVLGAELLKKLVVEMGIFKNTLPAPPSQALVKKLNRHGRRVASVTEDIIDSIPAPLGNPDDYIVASLLHDIGRLVLASFNPTQYEELSQQRFTNWNEFLAAEQKLFGATHQDVGAYFLRLWGFGEAIVQASALHHDSSTGESAVSEAVGVVRSADKIVHEEDPVEPVVNP